MRGKEQSLLLLVLQLMSCCSSDQNASYIETIINNAIDSAIDFEYPTNAFEYKPVSKKHQHKGFGAYDFIIIGGGTTGSILANRLSENNKWSILLLEAGGFGNDATDIPGLQNALLASRFNWGYKTVPQSTACLGMPEQKCTYNRGKGVGGSTLFNGLSYTRGSPIDFDNWGQWNPGWSYEEVLPYFKKSENFEKSDPDAVVDAEFHGAGGELNVKFRTPRHHQASRWLRANQERGYEIIDFNSNNSIGASLAQVYIKHGKRQDIGKVFIRPIANRKKLTISTESFVTKILICNKTKTAKGVEFVRKGQTYVANSKKEVLLSAGVIGSAQILMLSGIGPAEHLQELGIPVVEDLEVGSTLRDHHMFCDLGFTANYTRDEKSITENVEDYLEGRGKLTLPSEKNGMGFYQTKFEKQSNYPDQHLVIYAKDGFDTYLTGRLSSSEPDPEKKFSMCLTVTHSKSIGTLRLNSSSPFAYPLIDPNLLSDPEGVDLGNLYEGLKIGLDLINTTAYQEVNITLIPPAFPACDDKLYLSEEYWYCAFRQSTVGGYHPVGTCPMGPDPNEGAVVDTNCKVYGIENLRVADASVFPFTLSGHPSAPCMMIGEKVADLIKKQYLE